MEIVTLIENTSADGRVRPEFGLSLLVRCKGGEVLFDMGASARFSENAEVLGCDLAGVDCGVVSHAHYDHGGGLNAFLQLNDSAPIYMGRGGNGEYYGSGAALFPRFLQPLLTPLVDRNPRFCRYIGLDADSLQRAAGRLQVVEAQWEILPGIFLLTDIAVTHPLAEGNNYLLEKTVTGVCPDAFGHELIMVVREEDGLCLFTGCGHRGIVNMLESVEHHFPGEQIKAVTGGFHLALRPGKPGIAGSRDDIIGIGEKFHRLGIKRVITGHCTGKEACEILREVLGDNLEYLSTGSKHSV